MPNEYGRVALGTWRRQPGRSTARAVPQCPTPSRHHGHRGYTWWRHQRPRRAISSFVATSSCALLGLLGARLVAVLICAGCTRLLLADVKLTPDAPGCGPTACLSQLGESLASQGGDWARLGRALATRTVASADANPHIARPNPWGSPTARANICSACKKMRLQLVVNTEEGHCRQAMTTTLRLASYNLLEGLRPIRPSAGEQRQLDRERAEAARVAVRELRPDILVLNEALFCQQYCGHLIDYARLFDFPYPAVALYDGAWGKAILSRYSIAKSHEMRTEDRGGLVAVIDSPIGQLTVASYHPHPSREPEDKAADFVRLVADLTDHPLIVCGDLNCVSPEDTIDRQAMVAAFRRFAPNPEAAVSQFIESGRHVFSALGRLGLRSCSPGTWV